MIRYALILVASTYILSACQQPTPQVADKETATNEVATLFDSYAKATRNKDYVTLDSTLADDGLYLGTDPEEFWDKQKMMKMFKAISKDSSARFEISMDKREIRISQDGMMAIVIEQSMIPILSEEIYVRGVGHARVINGKWKIDFYSWSLVPHNQDLAKLNKALVK